MTKRLLTASLLAFLIFLPARSEADPGLRQMVMLFTGDVLVHVPVSNSAARHGRAGGVAYDFAPMFAEVEPVIASADWAVCHLEVTLAVPGVETSSFPRIAAPAAVADGLAAAGFDACSTSSNHALDFGETGVVSTISALDAAGVAHTGTAAGPGEANGILYRAGNLLVGHASYSYGFNGFRVPAESPWLANALDPERILVDAARLKRVGADFVVISLHWGAEYRTEPIAYQTEVAEALSASADIDLIVGHHAHVVQPFGMVGGKPVAFGLGNFLSNQTDPRSQDGVMLLVRFVRQASGWTVGEVTAVPTWVDRRGGHVIRSALDHPGLAASAARTEAALGMLGERVATRSLTDARLWIYRPLIDSR
jgi:poly-gamma-glutamate capsule biosynthesis protein CapA/YwtB (metallophosphatase superfamily)